MEILTQLTKITTKPGRRCGRGIGSGLGGHTSGRGAKGDKARGKTKLTFDGTKIKKSWIKRLPFLRGKNRLSNQKNVITFTLSQLDKWFKVNDLVDLNSLSQKTKISFKRLNATVKILSAGEITKALKIKGLLVSAVASKKIIAAGGNID
ncbi:MAG: 50S ribosomal protein L15 [Candidatus Shapirobacteria bacterium]|jgi:large subunit ribosomal protein L15